MIVTDNFAPKKIRKQNKLTKLTKIKIINILVSYPNAGRMGCSSISTTASGSCISPSPNSRTLIGSQPVISSQARTPSHASFSPSISIPLSPSSEI